MARVQLKNVEKTFNKNKVLKGINVEVPDGSFMVMVGPSGCGKSTALRCIAGLEEVTGGSIFIGDEDVTSKEPKDRNIAMVFQNYALYPHMNVFDNITYGLKVRGIPADERKRRAEDAAKLLGLDGLLDRMPKQLSGGQRQRVAMGRAIVREPSVFLFDEPLSNLDANLRNQMRIELRRLHQRLATTSIYVTHDQVEALTMSTRIALYRKGELVQVAPPLELYDNPVNLYTADFIGNPSINFVKGTAQVEAGGMRVDSPLGQLGFERGDMTEAAPQSGSVDVTIGVRPEQLSISRQADDAHWVEGHVYSGMPAGSETLVSVRVGDTMLTVKELGSTHYASDEPVYLGFNPKKVNVFETKSENLIKYCV